MDDEKKVRLKGTPSQSISSEQGTDDMLHDLNQLSGDDLKAIHKEINPNVNDKPVEEDPRLSPRTVQYLKFVRELFGRTYDIFGSDSTGMTRDQLYQIYDEMDESTAYVTSALDILSDDATQPDDDGNLIYIETENNKVRTIIETLFDDLEIENRLSKWARAIAKYGDLFVRVYGTVEGDKKGITSIDDTIYPSRINRKDFRGKLVAFSSIDSGINDEYDPPWTYVHFRHKGDLSPTRNKRNGIGDSDDVSLSSSYGQSILKAAVKVYTQLRFVENMILLSRLTNSVKRNIFAINVGETDPNSAFELIKNYSELLKKDINFKLDEDLYGASKHMSSYDEDIFLPVSDPKNDMTITSVGGDVNIPEQYDLEYLQNKLFAALKIPKAYLNYEQDLNARSTLIQLDIRYARSVAQLQTTIITGLTRMVKIHLAYMGIDPEMVDFEIKLTGVSAIDQESRLEQKSQRINAARDFWDIVVSVNDTLRDSQEEKPEGGTNPGGGGGPDFNIDLGGGGDEGGLEAPPTEDTGETEDTGSLEDELSDLRSSDLAPAESPEGATGESRRRTGKIIKEGLMRGMEYNSPLDLEYLASKLFSEYLDLPEDEVKIILRQETDSEKKESTKKKALDRHRHLAKHSIQDDVAIDYPTPEGRKLYESTVTIMQKELEAQRLQEDSDAIDMAD